jgi:Tetratricopeptide repeat
MAIRIRGLVAFALVLLSVGVPSTDAKTKHATTPVVHHSSVRANHAAASSHQSSRLSQSSSSRSLSKRSKSETLVANSRTRRGRHGKRSTAETSHKTARGKHGAIHVAKHGTVPKASYPEPHADYMQDNRDLATVYHLYDQGVNERLEGRYEQATKTLLAASNQYSSTKNGLTLEAMIDYELGQAAEANNNFSVAADAYARSLRIKPNLIEASVRLASMLMRAGQPQAALSRARETVALNPNDPRAHEILALVLDKSGLADDAKNERDSAKRLVRSGSSVNTETTERSVDSQAPGASPFYRARVEPDDKQSMDQNKQSVDLTPKVPLEDAASSLGEGKTSPDSGDKPSIQPAAELDNKQSPKPSTAELGNNKQSSPPSTDTKKDPGSDPAKPGLPSNKQPTADPVDNDVMP